MNDTTTPREDCLTFEIDLERRTRGALPADRVAALDAHLATCASCRAYQEDAGRLDAALTAAPPAPNPPNWLRVYRRIWWTAHAPHFALGLAVAFYVATIAAVVWLREGWFGSVAMLFVGWLIAGIPERIVQLRDRRRVLAELANPGDLLEFYRSEIKRGLRHALSQGFSYLVMTLFFIGFASVLWLADKNPRWSLGFAGGCFALMLYWWLIRRPWLRRTATEVDA